MKKLTKTKKIVIAILAVIILLAGVLFWNIDKILFPYDNISIEPYAEMLLEREAVEIYVSETNHIKEYGVVQYASKWENFIAESDENKESSVMVAWTTMLSDENVTVDLKTVSFDGEKYTLVCDGHYEQIDYELFEVDCTEIKEKNFKYLKEFEGKTTLKNEDEYEYYYCVLTNDENLSAEQYLEEMKNTQSDIYKSTHLIYAQTN
ncbi:MAG: hypothetical protein IJ447_05325 [Clostridia bacterium]|nr:hypothetical protein [Clostridia bacterium]